jgi:hypothetical protein
MEGHVALVALAEIRDRVLGPLVRLGQQHASVEVLVHVPPQRLERAVGLGQVLAARALALVEIGDGVEPHPVDPHAHPEVHRLAHGRVHAGVVVVEVGLVRIEPVPEIRVGRRVPGPVGGLEVLEDDAGVLVALRGLAPDVELARGAAGGGAARALEPGMLVGGVIDHQLGDHAQPALMGRAQEQSEIGQRAVGGMDPGVASDVVAVVAQRRGIERQEPQRGDAQLAEMIELGGQAPKVPDPVVVAVVEGADVQFVDDRVLVPERVAFEGDGLLVLRPFQTRDPRPARAAREGRAAVVGEG